ncbi:MAG TPA: orotidine-5'-phosphate decarboxylase [Methanoregula sp.]|nr:orotidine-5'-phosphate decarboxylase [Methanoregula sp.]
MPELILALDVTEKKKALDIAHACAPHLDAIKIGYPLALSAGLSIAGELKKEGLPLIADFKVADIPNTNKLICDQVFSAGFSGIICQGFTGMDSIKACVASAKAHNGECYVVAEMSHPGGKEFFQGGVAEQIAANAVIAGADGIIAPATRPDRVRVLRGFVGNKKILSPGIGTQGGDADAVASLVDGIIVGRSIYEATDPAAAAKAFAHIRRQKKA